MRETCKLKDKITEGIKESAALKLRMLDDGLTDSIAEISSAIIKTIQSGGKILLAGNGGSAADAQHIAAEFVGRYLADRAPIAAIALTTDTSTLTSISNDFGYEKVFSRQLEALSKPGDVFWAISTSGQSGNLVESLKTAKGTGVITVCLLGKDGGPMKDLADIAIVVPSNDTPRIQEAHIMIAHLVCEMVEKEFME
ncbi:Phosphoheptose isomerase 1 [hydrothermal vent metagenome]|uniref:D-sedoheptulose-7-phosphate isomerase n=1 Tax=hydrothermal vent metagenome TaxID=652676 RepID=A0A3B1C905_9ZZZZ